MFLQIKAIMTKIKPIQIRKLVSDNELDKFNKTLEETCLPKLHFMWGVFAPRFSGKSNMYVQIINDHYLPIFRKNIFIFSKTAKLDPTLNLLTKKNQQNTFHKFDTEKLNKIIQQAKEIKEQRDLLEQEYKERGEVLPAEYKRKIPILIIFDDMLEELEQNKYKRGKSGTNYLKFFGSVGRHYDISVMVIVQKYTAMDKTARINMTNSTFFNLSPECLRSMIKEVALKKSPEQIKQAYQRATSKPYGFLQIDHKKGECYCCFEHTIEFKKYGGIKCDCEDKQSVEKKFSPEEKKKSEEKKTISKTENIDTTMFDKPNDSSKQNAPKKQNKKTENGGKLIITKSTAKGKKFMVIFYNPKTMKKPDVITHFGAQGYENYTSGHLDEERKKNYQQRHSANSDLKNPNSAGFWAWYFLWDKKTYKEAIQSLEKRLRTKIIFKK